jgi:CheY-like chemotaxis protein
LGLAISRRLVEIMEGKMWVESQEDHGSTFYFTITAKAAVTKPQAMLINTPKSVELQGKRLLIVEDNKTHRQILNLQTKAWGMIPTVTASGAEALSLLERREVFDLAVLDMQMPGMDGVELAKRIRQLPEYHKLPLVVLSSLGVNKIDADAVSFAAILSKPIKQIQLHDALSKVLGGQSDLMERFRSEQEAANRIPDPTHSLRILLAEDNLVNQKVATHMLKKIGYQADVVMNGLEAIETLEKSVYDVVLMDLQMPKMDGLEATRHIINHFPVDRRPQIIAMTANAMEGDREICLEAGMNDYITKPIKIEQLAQALGRCHPLDARMTNATLN